ncbi:hypothetical protein KAW96_09895 [candidate division WOR-3 bacterium]|nr:hypothetical protein [candidate division WOR-3 bacterium]
MKYFKSLKEILSVISLFYLISPQKLYAYLDPGTGSFIFQLIIAALLGGLFAIKIFWKRIKTFLKNLFSKGKK